MGLHQVSHSCLIKIYMTAKELEKTSQQKKTDQFFNQTKYLKHMITSFLFWQIKLPYKPLDSRLMSPTEWPEQKHHHCENIYTNIQHPCEIPTSTFIIITVKHQEEEWYGVVSELYQRSWYKNHSSSHKVRQYPYFITKFPCLAEDKQLK